MNDSPVEALIRHECRHGEILERSEAAEHSPGNRAVA